MTSAFAFPEAHAAIVKATNKRLTLIMTVAPSV
jgi:hypothetical protein